MLKVLVSDAKSMPDLMEQEVGIVGFEFEDIETAKDFLICCLNQGKTIVISKHIQEIEEW